VTALVLCSRVLDPEDADLPSTSGRCMQQPFRCGAARLAQWGAAEGQSRRYCSQAAPWRQEAPPPPPPPPPPPWFARQGEDAAARARTPQDPAPAGPAPTGAARPAARGAAPALASGVLVAFLRGDGARAGLGAHGEAAALDVALLQGAHSHMRWLVTDSRYAPEGAAAMLLPAVVVRWPPLGDGAARRAVTCRWLPAVLRLRRAWRCAHDSACWGGVLRSRAAAGRCVLLSAQT